MSETDKKNLTDEEVRSAFASLADVEIAALDAKLREILEGVDRDWPLAMINSDAPPSIAFLLFSAVEALQESTREADELARAASEYDEEYARSFWETVQRPPQGTPVA